MKLVLMCALAMLGLFVAVSAQSRDVPLDLFARTVSSSESDAQQALRAISSNWRSGYAAMILDLAELSVAPRRPAAVANFARRLADAIDAAVLIVYSAG